MGAIAACAGTIALFGLVPAGAATFTRVGCWPDLPRLEPQAVCLTGDRLWVGLGNGVTVLDVGRPAHPVRLGTVTFPDFHGAGVTYATETRVYTANGSQPIHLLDATDPAQPTVLGRVQADKHVAAVYVRSNILYTSHNSFGLGITDISQPATALFGGRVSSMQASGRLEVVGQRVYMPSMRGLEIRGYTHPLDMELLGGLETGGIVSAVEVVGDLAYVAAHDGLRILNVGDPAHVKPVGQLNCPKRAIGVRLFGSLALLACDEPIFRVVDVADPARPTLLGQYVAPARITGFDATATHAFLVVAGLTYSLDIVRVEDPTTPTLAVRLTGSEAASQVRLAGSRAYLADATGGLQILDVRDSVVPVRLGNYPAAMAVLAVDGTASMACIGTWGELTVLDTTDPSQPVRVGGMVVSSSVNRIRLAGDRAYVLTGPGLLGELVVVSLADLAKPTPLGRQTLMADAWDLGATTNGYAALALGAQGLEILDARQPASLTRASLYAAGSAVRGVELQAQGEGFRAFLAAADGLEIVDFQPPTLPILRGRWTQQAANAARIRVFGPRAYLASADRLWALDISDPAHPLLEAETAGVFHDLDATSDYLAAAAGPEGLVVWRLAIDDPVNRLQCRPGPAGVHLDWTLAGSGWTLQQSTRLEDPSSWRAVPDSQAVTTLDLAAPEPAMFYRLAKP